MLVILAQPQGIWLYRDSHTAGGSLVGADIMIIKLLLEQPRCSPVRRVLCSGRAEKPVPDRKTRGLLAGSGLGVTASAVIELLRLPAFTGSNTVTAFRLGCQLQ